MNLTAAHVLARDLMDAHGLSHIPFEFDRARRRIGACHYSPYVYGKVEKITLSRNYVELLPTEEVESTIIHEIAHALAYEKYHETGHGATWKSIARSLGHSGDRCSSPSAKPEAPWASVCHVCGTIKNSFNRAPGRVRSCGECSNTFSVDHVVSWRKNGKQMLLRDMPAKYQREFNSITGMPDAVVQAHTRKVW